MHDIAPYLAAYRIDEAGPGAWRVVRRGGRIIADGLLLPEATRLACDLAERDAKRTQTEGPALPMATQGMQAAA